MRSAADIFVREVQPSLHVARRRGGSARTEPRRRTLVAEGRSALICDAKAAVLRSIRPRSISSVDAAALDRQATNVDPPLQALVRLKGARASALKLAVEIIDQRLAVHGKRLPGPGQTSTTVPERTAATASDRAWPIWSGGSTHENSRTPVSADSFAMLACGASLIALISAISASARLTSDEARPPEADGL